MAPNQNQLRSKTFLIRSKCARRGYDQTQLRSNLPTLRLFRPNWPLIRPSPDHGPDLLVQKNLWLDHLQTMVQTVVRSNFRPDPVILVWERTGVRSTGSDNKPIRVRTSTWEINIGWIHCGVKWFSGEYKSQHNGFSLLVKCAYFLHLEKKEDKDIILLPMLRSTPKLIHDQIQSSAHPCVPSPKLQGLDDSSSALQSGCWSWDGLTRGQFGLKSLILGGFERAWVWSEANSSALGSDQRQLRAQLGLIITSSSALPSDQTLFRTQLALIRDHFEHLIFSIFYFLLPRDVGSAAFGWEISSNVL